MSDQMRAHFGFTKTPFTRNLPPNDLHRHRSHQEATARINWCITERGLGVVTGEVGAGKTVAVRAASANLDASRHQIIYLGNPQIGTIGIYAHIVGALGGIPRFRKNELVAQTMSLLDAEENERDRTTVLIIDEAHLLARDQLEEIRMLTNTDMDSHSPLAVLLVGQPTLRRQIKLGTFAALDQRINVRVTLDGMKPEETTSYIRHHLNLAGRSTPVFTDDAIGLIHQAARGLPRAVNNLATHALTAAWATKAELVDENAARQAIAEINAD
jgi:type II secretory pathway predicted ATPase ExeA